MGTPYTVVAGVDGSAGGRRALRWAAAEARARGGVVRAVIAWQAGGYEDGSLPPTPAQAKRAAIAALTREIRNLRARIGPAQPITAEAVRGPAAEVLTMSAFEADELVLGSHGNGALRHPLAGSTAAACIRRARCPVVVIPARELAAAG
ncbi:universal stress protein [Spirilliplanes yamanashiensis]|uniref:Universal stress protein n=1 Tax=Spirilliplanes yamanashiensis TaxID=42233 RepID=A0A8J3YFE0_9ACTN|nr:universal stress protein [Spirilliplanes yamanashiensis]MDP9818259.1 nucleotide-binding universal stress UspA family protein [Spirilliplanes yamanashiensis]GIJ06677.1 universal stress protein [Spirilliplanes yamanashiensis]